MNKITVRRAFLATLPVMAGYLVLGIAYGILMENAGYSPIWALAMSVFIFAGSMQFVAIDLLTGGASLISTAIMTFLVNARHLLYSISMLEKYKHVGKCKPYLIFALTDETFALVVNGAPAGTEPKLYYLLVSLFDQCYWVTGSVLGALIGSALTFDTTGIDFAMTALFVVIFTEQLLTAEDYVPAAVGVLSAVVCLLVFGPDSFLIPTMLIITALLTGYSFVKDGRKAKKEVAE